MFGAATDAHSQALGSVGVRAQRMRFTGSEARGLFLAVMQPAHRHNLDDVVRAADGSTARIRDLFATSPFALSMTGLSKYRSTSKNAWEAPSIVVVGNTLEDFCLYFGLSRIRSHVYWLVPEWLNAFNKAVEGNDASSEETKASASFVTSIASAIRRMPGSFSPERIAVVSLSQRSEDLKQIIEHLDAASLIGWQDQDRPIAARADFPDDIRELVANPQVVFNTDNYSVTTTHQIEEGEAIGFFPTPKPKGFTTIVPYEHRWITELIVEDHLYPRHPSLGEWLIRHPQLSAMDARTGSRGICYSCPNAAYFGGDIDTILVRPHIYVPAGIQVFEHLAETAGKKCKMSDKGFYSRDTVEKLGGLATAAMLFRDSRRVAVLDEYLKEQNQISKGKFLGSDRRRYLDHSSITELLGTVATAFVDDFVSRHILHRGLILKCDFCRNADWFSLGEIDDGFVCKRCRRSQPILSRHALQQPEPVWFYKLDEIAYQGLRNNMHVPVLALDFLRRESKSFLYSDELEIWESEPQPLMEIDICCICDGVLTIGEAKSTDRIEGGGAKEVKALEKYREVALMFGARRFVLATSKKEWADTTRTRVNKTFRNTGVEVTTLTSKEIDSA